MPVTEQRPILEGIPHPDTIRSRLSELVHEAALLRGLLKLSERRHRQQEYRSRQAGGPTSAIPA
jgi:hypothetical protein